MDAAGVLALSVAIAVETPAAISDALLEIERLRVEKEDLAARAMTGRVAMNEEMEDEVPVTWGAEYGRIRRFLDDVAGEVERLTEENEDLTREADKWYARYARAARCPADRGGPYTRPAER